MVPLSSSAIHKTYSSTVCSGWLYFTLDAALWSSQDSVVSNILIKALQQRLIIHQQPLWASFPETLPLSFSVKAQQHLKTPSHLQNWYQVSDSYVRPSLAPTLKHSLGLPGPQPLCADSEEILSRRCHPYSADLLLTSALLLDSASWHSLSQRSQGFTFVFMSSC